jgi:RimJ/RimL family protein N-acetyltransferase
VEREPEEVPAPPVLSSRRVRLRPVTPNDYAYLYTLLTDDEIAYRWRYRGATPSPDALAQSLWQGTLAHFVIERRATNQMIGYASAFDANERNGWCHLGLVLDPGLHGSGWSLEAGALFVDYLFRVFAMRKLYGEVLEPAYADFASGAGRVFRVEGRFGRHEFYAGRYWDLIILAVYRDDWEAIGGPELVARMGSSVPS